MVNSGRVRYLSRYQVMSSSVGRPRNLNFELFYFHAEPKSFREDLPFVETFNPICTHFKSFKFEIFERFFFLLQNYNGEGKGFFENNNKKKIKSVYINLFCCCYCNFRILLQINYDYKG